MALENVVNESSPVDQRRLLTEFESLIKIYKINRPIMKNKVTEFFTNNNLIKDKKQMKEFMLCYIERITQLRSFNLSDLHMQILEFIADSQYCSAKEIILMIFETNFSYQNEVLWRNSLKLMRKIITQVDYKGVRDILGHLLSQFPKLPNTGYALDNKRRSHLEELIFFIISPEENLLPAYFVLDEVQKKKSIWKNASHLFRKKIETFIDRFYNIATLVSSDNRSPLLIISTLFTNNWLKLDNNGKFKLKGVIPYNPSITAPQKDLILFVLEQNRSFDNIMSILSLGTEKERNHFFEEALVELVLRAIEKFSIVDSEIPLKEPSPLWDTRLEQLRDKEALKKSQSRQTLIEFFEFLKESFHSRQRDLEKFHFYDMVDRAVQQQQSRMFWQRLTTIFRNFSADLFAQNISFTEVIDGICTKVEKLIQRQDRLDCLELSRDCFMFFLLNIVYYRVPLSQLIILKLIKIIEIFYSQTESKECSLNDSSDGIQSRNNDFNDSSSIDHMDIDSNTNGQKNNMDEDGIDTIYSYAGAALFVHLSNYCSADPVLNDVVTKVPEALISKVNKIWNFKENAIEWNKPYFNVILSHAYVSNKQAFSEISKHFFEILNWDSPIPLDFLESLPVASQRNLFNHIFTTLKNYTQIKCPPKLKFISHVETFFRLFNLNIETRSVFGLQFLKNFLFAFYANFHTEPKSWNHLYTLLELVSTRFSNYRIQVLHNINSKTYISLTNHPQIHFCIEQATLRAVINYFSPEVVHWNLQNTNPAAERLSFLPQDSIELNMLFVFSLGRAVHINRFETFDSSSKIFTELLNHINSKVTLNWSAAMYNNFPPFLKEYYKSNVIGINELEDKRDEHLFESKRLKFEECYRHFKTLNSDNEIISHLSNPSVVPYIFCIIFRSLMEGELWKNVIYKVLTQIGYRPQSEMLRTFCDYIFCLTSGLDDSSIDRRISIINQMIWNLNLFSLDRFILYICMRPTQNREAFSGLYIIQALLLKNDSFNAQVSDYLSYTPKDHWSVCDQFKSIQNFLEKYPEKWYFEHTNDDLFGILKEESSTTAFPVFLDNICLRLLSVLDVVIHRFIELPYNEKANNGMMQILKVYGDLYRYHDNPLTYLYYTMNYYFDALKDKENFKRQLVFSIVNSFRDTRPSGWALSHQFVCFYNAEIGSEIFNEHYYCSLINRLYIAFVTPSSSPLHQIDYRFNEFPNSGVLAVHSVCIEILSLPEEPEIVARNLIKFYTGYMYKNDKQLSIITTALSMLFVILPNCYNSVLYDEIFKIFQSYKTSQSFNDISVLLQTMNHGRIFSTPSGRIMSLTNAYLNSSNYFELFEFPKFVKERLKPNIESEEQLIFICYLIGPLQNRMFNERLIRGVLEITTELYDMLTIVDKKIVDFKYADTICDLLYHIKYQLTGDCVKASIIPKINELRPLLKEKLRYIVKIGEYPV